MEKLESDYQNYDIDFEVIMGMIDKINEIVDWINAREKGMKENADLILKTDYLYDRRSFKKTLKRQDGK